MLAPELDDLHAENQTIYATDIGKYSALFPNGVLRATFIMVTHRDVMSGSVDTFSLGRTKQSRVGRRS